MKYKWLNENLKNKELIVFFNGWGMDEKAVTNLQPENYDVLMFYDYRTLDTGLEYVKQYKKIHLVAWSMGVMAASVFDKFIYNGSKTAINGTLYPISSSYGIEPKIYQLTVKNFSQAGKIKFESSMFSQSGFSERRIFREDDIEKLKSELVSLKEYKCNPNFEYTKVYISKDDRIIPTERQEAFWKTEANLEGGHFPFLNFSKWSELL